MGLTTCGGCAGSGYQLAWLTYDQTSRWTVAWDPQSPVLNVHRQLTELRFLSPTELDEFGIVVMDEANGSTILERYRGKSRLIDSVGSSIHPRFERVHQQQYVKLVVVRREATYSMCGTSGTIVFHGSHLVGERTAQSSRAILRRSYTWAASSAVFVVMTGIGLGALSGATAYFHATNVAMTVLWLLGVGLAVPVLGSVLRSIGANFRFRPLRSHEKIIAAMAALALMLVVVIGVGARPRLAEVDAALGNANVSRARTVVDALKSTKGDTPEVREAEDRVLLAEASHQTGQARQELLDKVVRHQGSRGGEAATLVRAERLAEIRKYLEAKAPERALEAIDRGFNDGWKADPEVAEERARAEDLAGTLCTDSACRFQAAIHAASAATTPTRVARAAATKKQLVAELSARLISGEAPLAQLVRLRSMVATAAKALVITPSDPGIAASAKDSTEWAAGARARVPLIGASQAVVEELLGVKATVEGKTTFFDVGGTRVYVSLDASGTCRGLYAVGGTASARSIRGTEWSGDRLLSQAIGRPATVRRPTPVTATAARWFEAIAPVVARWRNGELIELRVGNANP